MNKEEINYWLEIFEETRYGFMSKDGKILSFYDTFKTMKDLQKKWNELKKWLEEESKLKGSETAYLYFGNVQDKMQELEGSYSNENN